MVSQKDAPIYEALHRQKNHISFHVPGHKGGRFFDRWGKTDFQEILSLDQTEIEGLDDLHHAESVIKEAEQLASAAFGAKETKFLVGGTTSGILALILAMNEGTIGVQRDSHRSLFNGLKLSRRKAVLLPPHIHKEYFLPTGVDMSELHRLLEKAEPKDEELIAFFLTTPNYFGFTTAIKELAARLHRRGIPLLVDEAHGAHYRFHPALPATALEQGADAVVQSTHKTLPAMTMASMIHWQGNLIDGRQVREWLAAIQSSSPSYPLMASLDLARRHVLIHGEEEFGRALEEAHHLKVKVSQLEWLKVLPNEDPLRLSLLLPVGWSHLMKEHLQSRGIYAEMETPYHLLFIFTPGNVHEDYEALWRALITFEHLSSSYQFPKEPPYPAEIWREAKVISYKDLPRKKRRIPLHEAIGLRSGEMVVPFPPGIPLLLEGEVVEGEAVDWITQWLHAGHKIYGIDGEGISIYDE